MAIFSTQSGIKFSAFCSLAFLFYSNPSFAQFQGYEDFFTPPRNYTVQYTSIPPKIDGKIDDAIWQKAAWTESFTDIEGDKKPKPTYNTHVRMLWGDTCLYIAAEIEEPHVWAYLKDHDAVVFHDPDFEVFIDPRNTTHQYYELELNAINTVFDLFMNKPYRNGSGAMISYDFAGLKTAVSVQGTLNNPKDTDKGWTVEIAIPFRSVTLGNNTHIPADGEFWRIGFSRVEWDVEPKDGVYVKKKGANGRDLPEHNWIWSPQGLIDMHYPERWAYLQFSKKPAGEPVAPFVLPYAEKQRQYLWLLYYKQKDYAKKNAGKFATSLADLGISNPTIDGKPNTISIEGTSRQFIATITSGPAETVSITHEGFVQGAPRGRGN